MRLTSFHTADGLRAAVVAGDELVDLAAADPVLCAPWAELVERGPACLDRVAAIAASGGHRIALDSVRLAAPVRHAWPPPPWAASAP